jgi:adenosine deaminase
MSPDCANALEKLVADMPKVELHLHLEGAIPLDTLFGLVRRAGTDPSIRSIEELRGRLTYTDFAHFIDVWMWKNAFIKDEADFGEIIYQVLRSLRQQNVRYVEAFYSPGDYWRQGLSTSGITECLIEGKERARRDLGIRCELIVDLVRDHGPEIGMQRLEEVSPYLGRGVIGVGLGGSEQSFPAGPFASVYREARERGFRLTAHAGEAAGAHSMWATIEELAVERIGHGTRAYEDPRLLSLLEEQQIPLEMCVMSNVRTGICRSVEAHPIKQYFDRGLMVTVNSDDPTMFNTSIHQEYLALAQRLGFTAEDLKRLSMNGVSASFMPQEAKETMRRQFEGEWQQLLDRYP